ncbi:MAG: Tc toxin subunit A, partial [Cyanobacteria bacterium J06633_1]
MSTIKIADTRLNSFYNQNPDFDILQFNFLNGEVDRLALGNAERGTTLALLQKYQRLLRIEPNPEIAEKLINLSSPSGNVDSAHAIASMTEAQFVDLLPEDEAIARQIHKQAVGVKAKTQLLWANMRDAVASPHFRSMRVSATENSDNTALAQDLPSYQDMFGDLDYIDCEHCDSIFSPAAYVVDLMRIIDQYITEPHQESIAQAGGKTLNQRRPDLAEIELTCDNTSRLMPSLQIINRILEARVKDALGSEDGLQSLAAEQYPFALPFHFPLEQIRSYLGHLKTNLGEIYKAFDVNELSIAREYIGLSLEDYGVITQSETSEAGLQKLYGVDNLGALNTIDVFLQRTGLSRTELSELLEQNLDQAELDRGLAHIFYINQGLSNSQTVRFKPITAEEADTEVIPTLENLTPESLDRIHRFIRLSRKLDWSFTDLNWVLTSIGASEIDEEAIKKIAKIKQLKAKYKLPLDVLCSFWNRMKIIGSGGESKKTQDLFNRVFNNPFKEILGEQFFPLQKEIQSIDLTNLSQEVESNPVVGRILAALRLNVNQFTDIAQAL